MTQMVTVIKMKKKEGTTKVCEKKETFWEKNYCEAKIM